MTDFLARQAYFAVSGGQYITNYGNLSTLISVVSTKLCDTPIPGFQLKKLKEADPAKLPPYIVSCLNSAEKTPFKGAKDDLVKDLGRWFASWYFQGPDYAVNVYGQESLTFQGLQDLEFGKLLLGTLSDSTLKYGTPTTFYKAA